MVQVTLSKEARRDLVSIRNYIRDELCNPDAAARDIASLKKGVQSLETFPGRGRPLDALITVHTEYRYLVCENYCIFYLEGNDQVIVVRILHQRQDSLMTKLSGCFRAAPEPFVMTSNNFLLG